jgi:hypothetical protein
LVKGFGLLDHSLNINQTSKISTALAMVVDFVHEMNEKKKLLSEQEIQLLEKERELLAMQLSLKEEELNRKRKSL